MTRPPDAKRRPVIGAGAHNITGEVVTPQPTQVVALAMTSAAAP